MDLKTLRAYSNADNIAEQLDEDGLNRIARLCSGWFKADKKSRNEWETKIDAAMKLAKQEMDEKNFPWPNCANTNYPLITTGAIQFNARAYPGIVNSTMVVKGEVIGRDRKGEKTQRGERIGKHMSYQYLHEQEEWEADTDALLIALAIVGDMFRKTFYDPIKGRNCSKIIHPKNMVYDYDTPFARLTRKTEVFELAPNIIQERIRNGLYIDAQLDLSPDEDEQEIEQTLLEQHCLLDLDGDGYKEPYVVTMSLRDEKILRIVSRFDFEDIIIKRNGKIAKIKEFENVDEADVDIVCITPVEYYTHYIFIPSPNGKGYNMGLGELLLNVSSQINTTLNQLLDAGSLDNQQGGFIAKGLRIKKGRIQPSMNEFMPVDVPNGMNLRENLVPFDFKGPSLTLFQLLGFLVEAGRDISSVKDIMTGESQGANESPTVYVSRINEGLKVFSAIFKRIHRSLKSEFKKQFRLNKIYMQTEQYFRILDTEVKVQKTDYEVDDIDVIPVSDPSMATITQKMAVTRAMNELYRGDPGVNQDELRKRTMEAMDVTGMDKLLVPPDQIPPPPPDPKLIDSQTKAELAKAQMGEIGAKIDKLQAEAQDIVLQTQQKVEALEQEGKTQEFEVELKKEELAGQELQNMKTAAEISEMGASLVEILTEMMDATSSGTSIDNNRSDTDTGATPTQ